MNERNATAPRAATTAQSDLITDHESCAQCPPLCTKLACGWTAHNRHLAPVIDTIPAKKKEAPTRAMGPTTAVRPNYDPQPTEKKHDYTP